MKLMPASRARWMICTASSWSGLPTAPNIIAPRHSWLTETPVRPRGRQSMESSLRCREGIAALEIELVAKRRACPHTVADRLSTYVMASPESSSPVRRADAERNRGKILEAARAAFADPEAEISMAEVSRLAGVGMATLYRNFPGRRELLEALYIDEVDAVCEAASALEADTP